LEAPLSEPLSQRFRYQRSRYFPLGFPIEVDGHLLMTSEAFARVTELSIVRVEQRKQTVVQLASDALSAF
jgi:hypothetical protein